jgi:hypothetical protein
MLAPLDTAATPDVPKSMKQTASPPSVLSRTWVGVPGMATLPLVDVTERVVELAACGLNERGWRMSWS